MQKLEENKRNEIISMSHTAHGFLNAYRILSRHNWLASSDLVPKEERKYIVPADFVCLAFSVEVGLKALLMLCDGEKACGHELLELYNKLPLAHQKQVYSNVCSLTGSYSNEAIFEQFLEKNSKAFVTWRYSYEQRHRQIEINPDFLLQLSTAILNSISEIVSGQKLS